MMKGIRFHGRGGEGVVIAAELLAAAAFKEGKGVQAFPFFGGERRGAPVTAFVRISDRPIRLHGPLYSPNYVVVLSPFLTRVDVTEGLRKQGYCWSMVKVDEEGPSTRFSSRKSRCEEDGCKVRFVVAGFAVVNTVMLVPGRATKIVTIKSIQAAIMERWADRTEKER
jgi:2-oxoacid:acceptor oxidoreductase gamma subunit (pyruvate/2-ketoisovalerate family)